LFQVVTVTRAWLDEHGAMLALWDGSQNLFSMDLTADMK
jgi:hypothetical protein